MTGDPVRASTVELDRAIARILSAGTYASVVLLAIGVGLMFVLGIPAFAGGPRFDSTRLVPDLAHLRPEGFLWLGLITVVATPAARVLAALIGYGRSGERVMMLVAALILVVIALSVALARGLEG